jgi:hypothetical protein
VTTVKLAHGPGFLRVFAVLSLVAVAVGCFVVAAQGTPVGVWGRNPMAWALGAVAAVGISKWSGRRALPWLLVAAPLGLVAALLSSGQQGVHRWIDLGAVHMNLAELLLPAAVVAFGALATTPVTWLTAAVTLGLLIAQPDASQVTAFGGAVLVVVTLSALRGVLRGGAIILVAAAVAAAWGRPDPLAPVPEVEGIMALAWLRWPAAAVLAWAALVGAALAPILLSRAEARPVRTAALALTVYAMGSVVTPLLGAFPVPLVGMGMSPILGFWLAAGLLAALAQCSRGATAP